MKKTLKILLIVCCSVATHAQQNVADSLRRIYQVSSNDDSVQYRAAIYLYDYYEQVNRDSAFFYADQCVRIARRNNRKINEAHVLTRRAYQELNLGRYAQSLNSLLASFQIIESGGDDMQYWDVGVLTVEKQKKKYALNCAHHIYGILMRETLNQEQALIHFAKAKSIAVEINSYARSLLASINLGRIHLEKNNFDSALHHEMDAAAIVKSSGWEKYLSTINYYTGRAYLGKGDTATGIRLYFQSIQSAISQNNTDALTRTYHNLSKYHLLHNRVDSGIYYASKSLDVMKSLGFVTQIEYHLGHAYEGMYQAFLANHQPDSAFKYLALAKMANDSISQRRIRSLADFQQLTLNEQQRLQHIENEKVVYQNRVRTYMLLAGIGILLFLAIVFYRNNRQKQKAKLKIERAYDELKSTQQQLIQAEKMASLGELTAGIAHEIQNPLNFVNNFSEVNTELIDELKQELNAGNKLDALSLADDIRENNNKITFHGKRAGSIVKGMLQHSRTGTGQKEPTDINGLLDECLRLSYHGMRAKDRSFNARTETDFDSNIPVINIISQDIGRVFLNLFTNAFYSLAEKQSKSDANFEPVLSVATKREPKAVVITVRDNGMGISQKIKDKIFQPFFTTKPTGQGTGLGLSLSYDTIVKGHGGDIQVQSDEGAGAVFTIILPFI
jgi:signal transduction histidine kinase